MYFYCIYLNTDSESRVQWVFLYKDIQIQYVQKDQSHQLFKFRKSRFPYGSYLIMHTADTVTLLILSQLQSSFLALSLCHTTLGERVQGQFNFLCMLVTNQSHATLRTKCQDKKLGVLMGWQSSLPLCQKLYKICLEP